MSVVEFIIGKLVTNQRLLLYYVDVNDIRCLTNYLTHDDYLVISLFLSVFFFFVHFLQATFARLIKCSSVVRRLTRRR